MTKETKSSTFQELKKTIEYAKKNAFPRYALYQSYGMVIMALRLNAITADEYMELNHECVADGLNNPKYFD